MYHKSPNNITHTRHVNKHFGRGGLDELHLPGCRVSSISIRTEERLFGGKGDNHPRPPDPSCSAKVETDQKLRTYNGKDQVRYKKNKHNSGRGDIKDNRGNGPKHSPQRPEREVTNTQIHQGTNCPASPSSSSRPSSECLFNYRRLSPPTPRSIPATRATPLQKQVKNGWTMDGTHASRGVIALIGWDSPRTQPLITGPKKGKIPRKGGQQAILENQLGDICRLAVPRAWSDQQSKSSNYTLYVIIY